MNSCRYGFNGKEKDIETMYQHYGMSEYDPTTARFILVDPLAKKYPELTPYQFASNRPIDGIDLDVLEWMKTQERLQKQKAVLAQHTAINQQKVAAAKSEQAMYQSAYILKADTFGTGHIVTRNIVEDNVAHVKQNYYNAVGQNIAGGPFGAAGYMINGEQGSFAGAAVDQIAFSFGGVLGEGYLAKDKFNIEIEFSFGQTRQLKGQNYESYLRHTLGGIGSFTAKGAGTSREFDGAYGTNNKIWYEAKSVDFFGEGFIANKFAKFR